MAYGGHSRSSMSVREMDLSEDKLDLVKDFDRLSPDSQKFMKVLMKYMAKGGVYLKNDENRKQITEYQGQKQKSNVDASQANILVKPRSEENTKDIVERCLNLIGILKNCVAPAGVILDHSNGKINVSYGKYRKDFEFNLNVERLGKGNVAGHINVVTDNTTNEQHALKTIPISVFLEQEVRCWVDMVETRRVPFLYMFRVIHNTVELHMEIIKKSLTLRSIIDDHMQKIDRPLRKPFSFSVLKNILEDVSAMHGKNWVHNDLHAANVMLQNSKENKLALKTWLIDFGRASRLETRTDGLDFRYSNSFIVSILEMFCDIFVGNEVHKNLKKVLEYVKCNMDQNVTAYLFFTVEAAMRKIYQDRDTQCRGFLMTLLQTSLEDILTEVKLAQSGNVMLQNSKEKMLDIKSFDFGMVPHVKTPTAGFNSSGFRSDIASVLRIFCALYVGNEFKSVLDIQENWKQGLEDATYNMDEDEKEELFCLVESAMCIEHPDDVSIVIDNINRALSKSGQTEMEVHKRAAASLFPEQTPKQDDIQFENEDCTGDVPITIKQQC